MITDRTNEVELIQALIGFRAQAARIVDIVEGTGRRDARTGLFNYAAARWANGTELHRLAKAVEALPLHCAPLPEPRISQCRYVSDRRPSSHLSKSARGVKRPV